MTTAKTVLPIFGDKRYQRRARLALPRLVRQATAGVTVTYQNLARELEMSNPRNLNRVLGSIGRTLEGLAKEWGEDIPPIQCLVVNKKTGMPGEGIGWFLIKKQDFSSLSKRTQRDVVNGHLAHIYTYQGWGRVLEALGLSPVRGAALGPLDGGGHGGGATESAAHKALKEYVATHPEVVGLSAKRATGDTETTLSSGDRVDVSFRTTKHWLAAEVKSARSNEADLVRGIFQCVKYRAVLEAMLLAEGREPNVRVVLVLESDLPDSLVALRNLLGVEVVEQVDPSGG